MKYPVTEIFRSLQGEGHFVGYPMTFVRLAGCSVTDCSIRKECDEAPWKATSHLTVSEILDDIGAPTIVCVTGGEPTDHDVLPLIAAMREAGHRVHMETSGVKSVEGWPLDWLTVSPKTDTFKQRTGHVLKVVVRPEWSHGKAMSIVNGIDAGTNFFHRYLQPMTDKSGTPTNLQQVIAILLDDTFNADARWALSTQAHRFWGIR